MCLAAYGKSAKESVWGISGFPWLEERKVHLFCWQSVGENREGDKWQLKRRGTRSVGWPAPLAGATGLCTSDHHCLVTQMWLFLLLDVFRKNVELTKPSGMKASAVCSHSQPWLISLARFEGNYETLGSPCFIFKMGTVAPRDLPGHFWSHLMGVRLFQNK